MSEQVTISWRAGKKLEADKPGLFSALIKKALGIDPGARIYIRKDVLEETTRTFAAGPAHPLLTGGGAVPRKQWPEWAHKIAEYASDTDKGVGDTVAREIGEPASAAFKLWYEKLFGGTCRCAERQAEWNLQYPYGRAD